MSRVIYLCLDLVVSGPSEQTSETISVMYEYIVLVYFILGSGQLSSLLTFIGFISRLQCHTGLRVKEKGVGFNAIETCKI
jgi:hypothetical protein